MTTVELRPVDIDRFESKICPLENGCWYWIGTKEPRGYGFFKISIPIRRQLLAHRLSYELFVGPIPDELTLDHTCRITSCVNPRHLEPVSRAENVRRSETNYIAVNVRKTHCPEGHAFHEHRNTQGARVCKICIAAASRRAYLRKLNG